MFTFIATLHIIAAIGLIFLVLVQDAKGGATGGMFGGGGGSQSILGATGATNLFVKLTRYIAVVFAFTCILLWALVARQSKSVIDGNIPAAVGQPATPQTGEVPPATPSDQAPAAAAGASPAASPTGSPVASPAGNK